MIETIFARNDKLASRKILDGPTPLTYADVARRCRQLNAYFIAAGLKPGDRIGIAATDEPEVAALILSCMRLGFPVAMIDAAAKVTEVSHLLARLELKALFLDPQVAENWSAGGAPLQTIPLVLAIARQKKKLLNRLLSKKEETTARTYPDCLGAELEPTTPQGRPQALLLCTSGTTGMPKILQLNMENLLAAANTTATKLGLNQDSRILNLLPLTHYDGIISGLFTAFTTSATQIRLGPFSVSLLPDIFDAVYKHRITHVLLTPSILALMLRLGEEVEEAFRSSDFQFLISVAATLPPKLWSDFQQKTRKKVVNVYGLSETGNNLFAGPDQDSYRIGAIGKPVDCRAIIVNEAGQETVVGETGELLLEGSSITSGYLGEKIATISVGGTEWFATGDLATRDMDGVYWLAGRKKNIIIVGGRNVYPDEISNALLLHPSVIEVATVGVPDDIWGERVVTCVVAQPGVSSEDLMQHAAKHLTDYKAPREIYLLPALPRGRSGKVLGNELIAMLTNGSLKKEEKSKEKIEDRILRLASQSFRVPLAELSPATAPANCSRWDSVAHMDFVVNAEKEFAIELLPREVIRITSLEAATQVIREKLAG